MTKTVLSTARTTVGDTNALSIHLACRPPHTTAQQKRVRVIHGKPVFFHGTKMRAAAAEWAALLQPYRLPTPITGPTVLRLKFVYPHLAKTPNKTHHLLIPKVSKPDIDNIGKHLTDVLVTLGFLEDDQQVYELAVSKYHGPDRQVGISIMILGE